MAKVKRLNKNLVAFLTIMGMLLIVSVVSLVVFQQSQRDPKLYAQQGRDFRRAGDLEEAARWLGRAWDASLKKGSPDPEYAAEMAECLFELGDLANWRGLFETALAKLPGNERLLVSQLEGLWRIRDIHPQQLVWPDRWRDVGDELQRLKPDSAIARASYVQGLWVAGDERDAAKADELAQQLFAESPTDPHVAITYCVYLGRKFAEDTRRARERNARDSELGRMRDEAADRTLAVLERALAAHADDPRLVANTAGVLHAEAQRDASRKEADRAKARLERATQLLSQTLERQGDDPAAELKLLYAQCLQTRFELEHPDPEAVDVAREAPSLDEIDRLAAQATELDPALFDAYVLRADHVQRFARDEAAQRLPLPERLSRALDLLDEARNRTLTLRSLRATLRAEDRVLLLKRGFEIGMAYHLARGAKDSAGTKRAESFLNDAEVKYREHQLTYWMRAQQEVAAGNLTAAISALEDAIAKAEARFSASAPAYWLVVARVPRLPPEQLSLLYREQRQLGKAAKLAEQALREYAVLGYRPPITTVRTRAELLAQLGEFQAALDLLNAFQTEYKDDRDLSALRASVLQKLGRPAEEVQTALAAVSGDDLPTRLFKAQRAAELGDASAADVLRAICKDDQATTAQATSALRSLLRLQENTSGRAAARAEVQRLLSESPPAALVSTLQQLELELRYDPRDKLTPQQREELDAERLKLLQREPDPLERATALYGYYLDRDELETALKYLEEAQRLKPDDLRFAEEEFRVRLRLKHFERAGALVAILSQCDHGRGFDQAGGATYRGDLALAKQDPQTAVQEYRNAVERLPDSAELQTRLARACLVGNRYQEGVEALQRAIEINPRYFDAYYYLRNAYRRRAELVGGAQREELQKLANEAEAKATELNPNHPDAQAWKREADEERDPFTAVTARMQTWTQTPADQENLLRLTQLLVRACDKAAASGDEATLARLKAQAEEFFPAALQSTTAEARSAVLRAATGFYSLSKQVEKGEALLKQQIAALSGNQKLEAQLLLAVFYESLGNPDGAEQQFQAAQVLAREVAGDATTRRAQELQVGKEFIAFYQRNGRPDKVVDACRWLLDRLGAAAGEDARGIRLILMETLVNSGRYADAQTEATDFLRTWPDDLGALTLQAQLHLARGEREQASEVFTRVLQKSPDNVFALYSRGRLALMRGRYDRAKEDLTRALAVIDRNPRLEIDVRAQLATLYVRQQQYDLAETELRNMLVGLEARQAPSSQKQKVVSQLARLLYQHMNQFDRARQMLSEYMEKQPAETIWPYEMARLYEAQADRLTGEARQAKARGEGAREKERTEAARQSYASAANYYQRTADVATKSKNTLDAVGATIARLAALNKAGRESEVVRLVGEMRFDDLPPDVKLDVRARVGLEAARALKDSPQARPAWGQTLMDASIRNAAIVADVSNAMTETLGPAEAEALLRDAMQQAAASDPARGQRLRLVLAAQLARGPNPAAALPELQEVLRSTPPGTPERFSALLTQAQVQERTGDPAGAVATYREVLKGYEDRSAAATSPDYLRTALNNLAYLLVTAPPPLYAPAEALRYVQRLQNLITASESAATVLDTVAWVYFKNNDVEAAAAAIDEAAALGDLTPTVAEHLAEIFRASNRLADARAYLRKAIDQARERGDTEAAKAFEQTLNGLK